ncbi:MAG: glycosyltransferase family 2 protein [Muribaculaceae bacterium]|nr:glycosyltransferase family 2 protein [Muribaculaceae bacterium]
MKLSVVVICWNSLANLRALLASLPQALEGLEAELIVVDNGSTDSTGDYVRAEFQHAVYRRLDRNYGVAYARNRGIEMAKGDYIWLLDDDTVINRRAVEALTGYLDEHAECGICACALRDEAGLLQQSYKPYPSPVIKLRNLLRCPPADPYAPALAKGEPFEPVYVIGACQMIRREVFEAVGLLDQKIFYGPEDADFCIRARRGGWRVMYLPYVSIIHKWKRITNRRPWSKIGREHIRALIYFYLKT